jgi:hypothetical protein
MIIKDLIRYEDTRLSSEGQVPWKVKHGDITSINLPLDKAIIKTID